MKYLLKKIKKDSKGVITLEMLMALAIIVATISAVIMLVFAGQSTTVGSQTSQEALYKAQKQIEDARAVARADFNDPSLDTGTTTTTETNGITYTINKTVTPSADGFTKQVTSEVTWGSGLKTILSTIVTDWNGALGNICNPKLTDAEAWKNPTIYPPGISPEPPGFPTTELVKQSPLGSNANGLGIADIKVLHKKLYIAASAPAGSDDHTFYVASLPNNLNDNPKFLGWAPTIGGSLNALTVAPYGNKLYAYVAGGKLDSSGVPTTNYNSCLTSGILDSNKCAQLQVIDVTPDTAGVINPTIEKNILINAKNSGAKLSAGKSIFYYKGYIYLGLTIASGGGSEFNIIDVGGGSGSPKNPIPLGTYPVTRTINSISVKDNYAYLATTDNIATNKQLLILNITTKTGTPGVAGYFNVSGAGTGNFINLIGNKAYFGRSYSVSAPEFYILNTDPASIAEFTPNPPGSHIDIGTSTNTDSVNAITVRDKLAFLITNKQFQVWNISNFADMYQWTPNKLSSEFISFSSIGASGSGEALNCSGDYIYLGAAFKDVGGNSKDIIAIIGPHVDNVYQIEKPNDVTVIQGSPITNNITATKVSGFPLATTFSASVAPAQSTITFNFNSPSCIPTCTSLLTINTTGATPANTYVVTVTGTGGITNTFNLTVTSKAIPTIEGTIYNASNNQPITSVPPNTSLDVYEKITMTGSVGTPTGTIDFMFYKGDDNCGNGSTDNSSGLLDTNGLAQSVTSTTQKNKSSSYLATYSGDTNYANVSLCKSLPIN